MYTFNAALYAVAALTSIACTVFLVRGYLRDRLQLLLWSALCFVGLSVNNLLLFLDLIVFVDVDLRPWRLAAALVGLLFLLYGFIWEAE